MNPTRIASLLVTMIIPFAVFAQTAERYSHGTPTNKANQRASAGFYFHLWMPAANAPAGWEDEAIKLFRAAGIPAFDGDELPYKGITFEPFIPIKSLRAIEKPRRLKSVWVGAFETEEAATSALEKFSSVLRPILRKIKHERAELKENADFKSFDTWSIGAIKISGSEVEKPNSRSEEAAAMRGWNEFWTRFRAAVENRDASALRPLAAFSIWLDFRIVRAEDYLKDLDGENEIWKRLDASLATGAKRSADASERRPTRTSGDGVLVFYFSNGGRWRWRSVLSE